LSELGRGDRGIVIGIEPSGRNGDGDIGHEELERRLLEMGFVEGARFQILHEGLIGRDPIAIKLDDMRVALRRRDAHAVTVEREPAAA
jgi:ferrous iron transport protein A